jgi:large subunit ribosomal protein L27Ae
VLGAFAALSPEANIAVLCSHPGYFGKKGQRHFHL